jgi:hypothetical protein
MPNLMLFSMALIYLHSSAEDVDGESADGPSSDKGPPRERLYFAPLIGVPPRCKGSF